MFLSPLFFLFATVCSGGDSWWGIDWIIRLVGWKSLVLYSIFKDFCVRWWSLYSKLFVYNIDILYTTNYQSSYTYLMVVIPILSSWNNLLWLTVPSWLSLEMTCKSRMKRETKFSISSCLIGDSKRLVVTFETHVICSSWPLIEVTSTKTHTTSHHPLVPFGTRSFLQLLSFLEIVHLSCLQGTLFIAQDCLLRFPVVEMSQP